MWNGLRGVLVRHGDGASCCRIDVDGVCRLSAVETLAICSLVTDPVARGP